MVHLLRARFYFCWLRHTHTHKKRFVEVFSWKCARFSNEGWRCLCVWFGFSCSFSLYGLIVSTSMCVHYITLHYIAMRVRSMINICRRSSFIAHTMWKQNGKRMTHSLKWNDSESLNSSNQWRFRFSLAGTIRQLFSTVLEAFYWMLCWQPIDTKNGKQNKKRKTMIDTPHDIIFITNLEEIGCEWHVTHS